MFFIALGKKKRLKIKIKRFSTLYKEDRRYSNILAFQNNYVKLFFVKKGD